MNEPETIQKILEQTKTIAVVGLSEAPGAGQRGRGALHEKSRLPHCANQSDGRDGGGGDELPRRLMRRMTR